MLRFMSGTAALLELEWVMVMMAPAASARRVARRELKSGPAICSPRADRGGALHLVIGLRLFYAASEGILCADGAPRRQPRRAPDALALAAISRARRSWARPRAIASTTQPSATGTVVSEIVVNSSPAPRSVANSQPLTASAPRKTTMS